MHICFGVCRFKEAESDEASDGRGSGGGGTDPLYNQRGQGTNLTPLSWCMCADPLELDSDGKKAEEGRSRRGRGGERKRKSGQ